MGIIDNLGYIKQASYYPCAEPDPLLVIQAAGAAAFPTLLSAISFGCNDIVKMRAGISPWHARNMKALIDGAIPAEQQKTFNGLYKFVVPVEKALFFFFVVDLTLEFLARWQSQIFKRMPLERRRSPLGQPRPRQTLHGIIRTHRRQTRAVRTFRLRIFRAARLVLERLL
jgi:hypothetical protein